MQNLLEPLHIEPERKDKMSRALTKIDQYNRGSDHNNKKKPPPAGGIDVFPIDGISKYLPGGSDKPPVVLS